MLPISIDFVAGSHGHFLEYVCNRFIAKQKINFSPFDSLGASHASTAEYQQKKIFKCNHYSNYQMPTELNVVKISFGNDDLLALSSVCFLRAGNSNIDVSALENNTYNKLKDGFFKDLINKITLAYPNIVLNASTPNCPRYILREFFKFGFKTPKINGFTSKLQELQYSANINVFDFEFNHFYNTEKFITNITRISQWCGITIDQIDQLELLHTEFLSKQIFKDHKQQCDYIIDMINKKQNIPITNLTILQESYINGCLENLYNIEMPFMQEKYFNLTQDVLYYLNG